MGIGAVFWWLNLVIKRPTPWLSLTQRNNIEQINISTSRWQKQRKIRVDTWNDKYLNVLVLGSFSAWKWGEYLSAQDYQGLEIGWCEWWLCGLIPNLMKVETYILERSLINTTLVITVWRWKKIIDKIYIYIFTLRTIKFFFWEHILN